MMRISQHMCTPKTETHVGFDSQMQFVMLALIVSVLVAPLLNTP